MAPATYVYKLIIFSSVFAVTIAYDADAIAQAACAASTSSGFVSAIRRTCGIGQPTCATVCRNAIATMRAIYGNQGSTTATCFEAFHFYYRHANLKPGENGKALMAMYRYGVSGCQQTSCGPNFCCCRA